MSTLAFAATDGMLHYELATACEIFTRDPSGLADPWYNVAICASGPVRIGRFQIEPDAGFDQLARADTVIIPALDDVDAEIPAALLDAVRTAHRAGARMVSLCTGAFVLAEVGILDGLRVTTHWAHTDALAARYPRVKVDPDVLYVDNGQVLASAGKAAAIDLCLHLIRRDHGPSVANADNVSVDPNFGVTAPIYLDQVSGSGRVLGSIAVPTGAPGASSRGHDQLTGSFSSKSEGALNLSTRGDAVTFMGYAVPANTIDASNGNTPGVVDPTNPDAQSVYRAVGELDENGKFSFTETNAYSGDNGRAAVLDDATGLYYTAGNSNNGSGTSVPGLISGTGAQL